MHPNSLTAPNDPKRRLLLKAGLLAGSGLALGLVVNGSNDLLVPTINSFKLYQSIPDAQLILYPDSGHGALFQYPERFIAHASGFLDQPAAL